MIGDRVVAQHTWTVQLRGETFDTDGPKRYPMSGEFTLDESWSPYGQGKLVFDRSLAPEFAALEPDGGDFLSLSMEQSYGQALPVSELSSQQGAGRPLSALSKLYEAQRVGAVSSTLAWHTFDGTPIPDRLSHSSISPQLMIRSRELDPVAGTVTIGFATKDALLQDHAHMSATVPELLPPAGSNRVYDLVNWVLSYVGEHVGISDYLADTAKFSRDDNPWRTGQTAAEYLQPILQTVGLLLWCDDSGVWWLMKGVPTPDAQAVFSGTASVIETRDLIDMDRTVVQSVLVIYEWTDAAGQRQTRYDAAQHGDASRRPKVITYQRKYPGPGAAARILAQLLRRTRAVPLTAVSDYRVAPGMTSKVLTVGVTGNVRAVTWAVPEDRMTITLRDVTKNPEV